MNDTSPLPLLTIHHLTYQPQVVLRQFPEKFNYSCIGYGISEYLSLWDKILK